MNYSPPAIDYVAIAPMIVIFGAAIVSVLIEAFTPRSVRRYLQLLIVFGSLIAAAALIVINASSRVVTAGQAIVIDGPALVLQGAIVIIALLGAALMAERSIDSVGDAFASRVSSSSFCSWRMIPTRPGSCRSRTALRSGRSRSTC